MRRHRATAATAPAAAAATTYDVSVDTASLSADAADEPFAPAVQLNSGGTPGVSNAVALNGFAVAGGSAGDPGTIDLTGGAFGSPSTGVQLDTAVSAA